MFPTEGPLTYAFLPYRVLIGKAAKGRFDPFATPSANDGVNGRFPVLVARWLTSGGHGLLTFAKGAAPGRLER
jgi:hypothetical protein